MSNTALPHSPYTGRVSLRALIETVNKTIGLRRGPGQSRSLATFDTIALNTMERVIAK